MPRTSERIRGFTLPRDGHFYVVDYDEVFRIRLGTIPSLEVLDENPDEFARRTRGLLGVFRGEPQLRIGDIHVSFEFNPTADYQSVTIHSHGKHETIEFRSLSGDWFVASLSDDGKYVMIAEPYLLELYALEEEFS